MKAYVFDLETSGLKADVHTLLIATFGQLKADGSISKVMSKKISDFDSEKELASWTADRYMEADVLIGFNSIGFDKNFLNGVLLRYSLPLVGKKIHIDLFQTVKGKTRYGSISMEALLDTFDIGKKDKPKRADWRTAGLLDEKALERLEIRCKSDVKETAKLWQKLKPLYFERWGK